MGLGSFFEFLYKYKSVETKTRLKAPKLTLSQRASDKITGIVGSWWFIFGVFALLAVWMVINAFAFIYRWDPYPFILLNFVLSTLAAIQAPIILMSQNRQSEIDRVRAEYDYQVNIKAEAEITDLQKDVEIIKSMLQDINKKLGKSNIAKTRT